MSWHRIFYDTLLTTLSSLLHESLNGIICDGVFCENRREHNFGEYIDYVQKLKVPEQVLLRQKYQHNSTSAFFS